MKKHNGSQFVFVLAPDGQPIMPTLRGGRVRWLLKTGKAKVIKRIPFTIQILDKSIGCETQDITLGIDTGTSNIGVSSVSKEVAVEYISATYETNTKGIKSKMEKRATAQDENKLSLADFRIKYGKKAVSQLKVVKGTRMWINNSGYKFNKGDTIYCNGKADVIQGNSNGGAYLRLASAPLKNIKPSSCRLIQRASGFVRVA